MILHTEQESAYNNLDQLSTEDILKAINHEDQRVASAVADCITAIHHLVDRLVYNLAQGGRLFYVGAGTSGRLGILDASECPPTFGVNKEIVQAIIAGGDQAIRNAVENAEDNVNAGWETLTGLQITSNDFLIGISASGTTPYVLKTLKYAKQNGILTGCIVCNANSPIAQASSYPIAIHTGAEFLTGSTRMKAGTAQKMVLNMISTTAMIRLGKVMGNKMVDMQLSNDKLRARAMRILVEETGCSTTKAQQLIEKHQKVRLAMEELKRELN
ncbi:N-acetylmuramic acid 6-phosphate etherase [Sphingobacterium pedocola]|nr:N-acetylmuramic acid 6-phosphate etherase [Sphingobacterium pedocola]